MTAGVTALHCAIPGAVAGGTEISCGSHPIVVEERLTSGKTRRSNLLPVQLIPLVSNAVVASAGAPSPDFSGSITVSGQLLGTDEDDIFIALYREGTAVKTFDNFTTAANQQALTLTIATTDEVAKTTYRLIVRVNGQQANNSPSVILN